MSDGEFYCVSCNVCFVNNRVSCNVSDSAVRNVVSISKLHECRANYVVCFKDLHYMCNSQMTKPVAFMCGGSEQTSVNNVPNQFETLLR